MWDTWVWSLHWEDPLEKELDTTEQLSLSLLRNSTSRMCKGLAHEFLEADKTKICTVGQLARESGTVNGALQAQKSSAGRIPSCSGEGSVFCSFQTFNWWDEAHPHYGEQSVLLKVHQLKYKSPPKHPHGDIQNNVWLPVWALWSSWVARHNEPSHLLTMALTASSQPWLHNGITRRALETTGHWGLNPTKLNQKYELDVKIFKRSWVVFMYRKVWEQSSDTTGPSYHYDLPLYSSVDSLQPCWAFFDHSEYTHTHTHTHTPARDACLASFRALLQHPTPMPSYLWNLSWSPQATQQSHFSPWLIFLHYTINTWNTRISSYSLFLYLSIFH